MKPPPKLTPAHIAQVLGDASSGIGGSVSKKPVFFPGRLVSLWEIVNTLNAIKFARTWESLCRIREKCEDDAAGQRQSVFNANEAHILQQLLSDLQAMQDAVRLGDGFLQIVNLRDALDADGPWFNNEIGRLLRGIEERIGMDLSAMVFVQVPMDKAKFFNDPINPLGKEVHDAFESARPDILAAGNCLALDLNTAAVFHLMRIVEFGMRDLAVELGVRWMHKTVETADWGALIKGMRGKIERRQRKWDKSKRKKRGENDLLRFYSGLVDEMNVFRENWRNNTMHAHNFYTELEAFGVYIRVRDFMIKLAKRQRAN